MQAGLSSDYRCPACYRHDAFSLRQSVTNDESTQPRTFNDCTNDSGHGKLCRQRARRHHPEATGSGCLCLRKPLCWTLRRHAVRRPGYLPSAGPRRRACHLLASVNYTGTTSLEVGIKVITENIQAHLVRHANSCFFTMVAVDEGGKPTAVPPFKPSTPDEQRRFEGAKVRKEWRRELEARYRAMKQSRI